MAYWGPLPYIKAVTSERAIRRKERRRFRAQGKPYPRLHQIARVDLDKITVPAWAKDKAIRGLTITDKSVWLRRIAARKLAREDEAEGGYPRLTFVAWKPCGVCHRPLIGPEAEMRNEIDKKSGKLEPCGPDCVEIRETRRARKGKRQHLLELAMEGQPSHAPAGNQFQRDVRNLQADQR